MYKLKTRRSALKRINQTKTGKLLRRKAFKNHLLANKNHKRRKRLSQKTLILSSDKKNVQLMLPYL
uniref:50S ribosomal protein L35 n=1 Tax=Gloeochaete wittrockiana TaxID=38269 RepID=A0A3G1IVY9_9EUKA|nr:ribosomal protein L35 [Gloeochaete wittrockiana]ASQ40201.1 ribosomal protein L35 [Gloeochaete wittrockiana]